MLGPFCTYIQHIFRTVVILVCLAAGTVPISAQNIILNTADTQAAFKNIDGGIAVWSVNGRTVRSVIGEDRDTIALHEVSHLLWSMTALRLAQDGVIDLDIALHDAMPHILEDNPFNVDITARHLILDSAGFAVPPWFQGDMGTVKDLDYTSYLIQLRTVGQINHLDPVGRALLVEFLVHTTGKGPADLLSSVLGVRAVSFTNTYPAPFRAAFGLELGKSDLPIIFDLLLRNRKASYAPFLSNELHRKLVQSAAFMVHPMAEGRAYGGTLESRGNAVLLTAGERGQTSMVASADGGFAFLIMGQDTRRAQRTARAYAYSLLPGYSDTRPPIPTNLKKGSRPSGIYIRDDAPSAWLADRFYAMRKTGLSVTASGEQDIYLNDTHYRRIAPFAYENEAGGRVIFSYQGAGGYMMIDGILYRHVGLLGNPAIVFNPLLPLLVVMLSALVYLVVPVPVIMRRMAWFSVVGTILFATGLFMDMSFWSKALYEWDTPFIVVIWRIVYNLGLMAILAVPMFTLSIGKRGDLPTGWMVLVAPFHLAALGGAGMALFLMSVAWGNAGKLWPY